MVVADALQAVVLQLLDDVSPLVEVDRMEAELLELAYTLLLGVLLEADSFVLDYHVHMF